MSSKSARTRNTHLIVAVAGTVLGLQTCFNTAFADPDQALAESVTQPANSEEIPPITVSALRRETILQETPAAITALNGADLHNANITDMNSLTQQVPGLVITTAGPGQNQVALRGIRSSGDAQVGIYYGETPVVGPPGTTSDPAASSSNIRLFDVDQVEVLSGPQGTLYGAGAMGGAIRINFKKPDFNYGSTFDISAANTDGGRISYQGSAEVNVPVIDDTLAVRLVGYQDYTAGWIDNPGLGLRDDNDSRAYGGRLMARFTPTPGLVIDGLFSDQEERGGPPDWALSAGQYNAIEKANLNFEDTTKIYSITANADLDVAKLITTVSYQDRPILMERDPTPLFLEIHAFADTPTMYYQPQSVNDRTAEVRLQSNKSGPFQWTVGGYYEDRNSSVTSEAIVLDSEGNIPIPPNIILQRYIGDQLKQTAAFFEVSYEILHNLTFTQGERYYDYDTTVSGLTTIGLPALGTSASPYKAWKANDDGLLHKSNIAYKVNDSAFVYVQAASGFRPGGVNQAIGLATATPYLPDSLWTYEAGLKTRLLEDTLNINVSAYLTDWTDMQVSLEGVGYSYLGNAGSARIKGVEVEIIERPLPGLQLSGNATGMTALLTSDQIATGATPTTATGRAGDRVPYIPELTAALSAQYEWTLPDELNALVRTDASYVGKSYTDFHYSSTTPYYSLGNYTVFNGRAGITKKGWGAFIFANNLFNRTAIESAANLIGGSTETVVTRPPRTVGLNFTKTF